MLCNHSFDIVALGTLDEVRNSPSDDKDCRFNFSSKPASTLCIYAFRFNFNGYVCLKVRSQIWFYLSLDLRSEWELCRNMPSLFRLSATFWSEHDSTVLSPIQHWAMALVVMTIYQDILSALICIVNEHNINCVDWRRVIWCDYRLQILLHQLCTVAVLLHTTKAW